MPWCADSAASLKCKDYKFEYSLAGHLDNGSVTGRGSLNCECTGWCTLGRSVEYAREYTGDANFFILSLKLTNQKQPKVTHYQYAIKIEQSQMYDGKIATGKYYIVGH